MRKAPESEDQEEREWQSPLHPTRSGRSLKHRAATPIESRQERREAAEIAALKARIEQQASIESQWKIARDEVDAQKQARATDAARAAEKIARLESQVETATSHGAQVIADVSKQRNAWRAVAAVAGVAALAFLFAVEWPRGGTPPIVVAAAPVKVRRVRQPLPQDPHAALTTALDRLNSALETVHNRTPEQALRTAADADGCSIVWTNELPSIVFGTAPGPNSIAMTLEHCADAVEDFR